MRNYVILGAVLSGLLLSTSAEARRHHSRHAATRCAAGDLYRPSIGKCESRANHKQTMREAAKFERVSKRELRRMSKRERRAYQREMAAAEARAEREAEKPSSRLLQTRPYAPPVLVTNEAETQAAEAAMMPVEAPQKRVQTASADPEATMAVSRPKPPTADSLAPLPFKIVAPFSLNPKPRYISRVDFTTPFTVPE